MVKLHNQKLLGKEKSLFHFTILRSQSKTGKVRARIQDRNLEAEATGNAAYVLSPHSLLRLFSWTLQDPSRCCPTHNGLGPVIPVNN